MNKFVHVHMMKCGGSSLNIMCLRTFGVRASRDRSFRKDRWRGVLKFTDRSEKSYPSNFDPDFHWCVLGHFTAAKYRHLGWSQITFMRDPVERMISHYSIWKTADKDRDKNIFWFNGWFANHMTRVTENNLKQFAFVGITERYHDSIKIIEKVLDFKFADEPLHKNATPLRRKLPFSGRTRRILNDVNNRDRELYEVALRRWDKMAARYL